MPPTAMCGQHDVCLMLRRVGETGEVALACPYCDMEQLGGGESERQIIDDALREKPTRLN
jgi:hypothetical protein